MDKKSREEMDRNLGRPTIISQRGARHGGHVKKYRSNEDILREQAVKLSQKWGFELSSVADELPAETRQALGLGEEPTAEESSVVEPKPIVEPILEEPKPTFTEKKQEYLEAGLDEASANRMSAEFIQEGDLHVEKPVVEQGETDDALLERISGYQKVPTRYRKELDAALVEAKSRGILR